MLAKGKQFLLLISHPPSYSYIQSSPVKVLSAIVEEKIYVKVKDSLLCQIWIFRNTQPDGGGDRIMFVSMTSH